MLKSGSSWNLVSFLASSTKRSERGVLKASGLNQKEGQRIQLLGPTSKPINKLVSSHSETLWVLGQATGNMDSLDSPWPGLGGSHHLPPHSILCVCSWHLHQNDFLSRDSQGGVPKLSQFRLLGLWELVTPSSNLRLG